MVSIFIPTYNATSCIGETLKCLTEQSYRDIEVWVVDDRSTDGTPSLLEQWAEKDPRIKVLHKEKNEGFVPYSWNQVFPLLNGEFTLYMSHDDLLSQDCIEQLVKRQRETGAECIIPEVVFWNAAITEKEIDPSQCTSANKRYRTGQTLNRKQAFAAMLNYDIPGFALWKTDVIRKIGMPTEAWNSDEGMQRIWALNCNKVAISMEAKFYYRLTPESITKGLKPYHLTGLKTQERLLEQAIENGIWWRAPIAVSRFAWQYWKSAQYLKSKLQ